jgi:hypothetical protein
MQIYVRSCNTIKNMAAVRMLSLAMDLMPVLLTSLRSQTCEIWYGDGRKNTHVGHELLFALQRLQHGNSADL